LYCCSEEEETSWEIIEVKGNNYGPINISIK
jgi:hypothetical protein